MTAVQANGITIEYESIGDVTKPPLVLIMGLGSQLTHCRTISATVSPKAASA